MGGFALGIVLHPGRADFLYTWLITYVHVFLGILKGPLHDVPVRGFLGWADGELLRRGR